MKQVTRRVVALLLSVTLLMGLTMPVSAAPAGSASEQLRFHKAEGAPYGEKLTQAREPEASICYQDTDRVRVSILLEEQSTLEKGFSTLGIADNAQAMAYRSTLRDRQQALTAAISAATGEKLKVRWNLTLAANIISADVAYGDVDTIAKLPGVRDVVLENRYEPCVVDEKLTVDPNMSTSGEMIGTNGAWSTGYYGAGSRIAVIDSGLDTDHQSFDDGAFRYALEQGGEDLEALDLLDAQEIASYQGQLHAKASAQSTYRTWKIPFGYNYADSGLDITHLNDTQTEHGSHVAGIAAANRFIPAQDGTYTSALEAVKVQGVAPDAQVLVMKVFGASGGGYESDYMAAIEDALILGADAINLSMGSVYGGYTRNEVYEDILNSLASSDTVVSISASNSGHWADNALHDQPGYLYADDVNTSTHGAPGTYTNSLAVASVDNIGLSDYFLYFGEKHFTYAETDYDNEPIMTMVGEFDYILLPGFGTAEEFAALGDAARGKVAIVHRGGNSFYEKGNAAVEAGAIATIVINNTTGVINMDLTDYEYTEPFVSVTQTDGQWIEANSQIVADDSGAELYRTGKMKITGALDTTIHDSDLYSMSYFSSWGVPGSLELKPEITAPGGNIYSVNGKHQVDGGFLGGADQYENMSGTSMAAPQVAGMAALMAEYIRENGLEEKTGLTVRALSQSLLMSTAEALQEEAGIYYPVIRQGAGLANVEKAMAAASYILMDETATGSHADGKVKAELGDDPAKTGSYTIGFTIHDLKGTQQRFLLSAAAFTQAIFEAEGIRYMDTKTAGLQANVTWIVDGKVLEPATDLSGMDFNGDGLVNNGDVQAILDYAAGARENLTNRDKADLNADGTVGTYDAYLLLEELNTGLLVLPAGGSVDVRVELALTEEQKAALDQSHPDGAYIEGFVFAKELASVEGAEGITHSIPLLGFYGNWSQPDMFDKTTFIDSWYGDETVTYLGSDKINALTIKYPGDNNSYYFAGNPYFVEDVYPAERAAISAGSTLHQYQISLIRNAGAVVAFITDEAGEILWTGSVQDQVNAAFWYASYDSWTDTAIAYAMNKKVSTLDVREGDRITVTLAAVPEYYEQDGPLTAAQIKKLMQDDVLGEGVYLSTDLRIDNTAPELLAVSKDFISGNLTVTARDNQYISMISLQDRSGNELTEALLPEQTGENQRASVTFDLDGVTIGEKCYIVVADYADNQTVYEVEYGGEVEDYSGRMFAFTSSTYRSEGQRFIEIEPEILYYRNSSNHEGIKNMAMMDLEITAAEYVDGYVYMAADDGYLYVAKQGLWDEYEPAGRFGNVFEKVYDMAYNYADGKLYAMGSDSTVYSIGLIDGEFTREFTVQIEHESSSADYKWLSRLAIDDEGTFYSINNSPKSYSYLYKWTAEDIIDGAVTGLSAVGRVRHANYDYPGSLAWDHDNDVLYFANSASASGSSDCLLVTIDLQTGEGFKVNTTYAGENDPKTYGSRMQLSSCGLYIVPNQSSGIEDATESTKIALDITESTIWKGQTITVRPSVYPWTLTDKSVSWSSSDESVVQIADGRITGVGVGTASVTATTNAAPNLTAECVVTVEQLPTMDLDGLIYDADGDAYWAELTTDDPTAWTAVSDKTNAYLGGGNTIETIYAHDGEHLYTVDADDFTTTDYGEINSAYVWSDSTFAPYTEEGLFGDFMALANNGTFLETVVAEIGEVDYWDLTDYFAEDPMAVIAYHESGVSDYSVVLPSYMKYFDCPTQYYYMITESGLLHEISVLTFDDGYSYTLNYEVVGQLDLDLSGVAAVTDGRSASMIYDEDTGWLVIAAAMGAENRLYAVDPETLTVVDLGGFGENGEKLVALYQHDRAADLTVRLNKYADAIYVDDTLQLSARVKPNKFDQAVIWSSSDETIATVDENGLVTAVSAGQVTITATSAAVSGTGEQTCASCELTVKDLYDLNASIDAQIVTDEGTKWVSVDLSDMSVTVNADAQTTLTGAGMFDGKFYGTDSDLSSAGTIYQVDPENGYAETAGVACPVGYAFLDVTQAPVLAYKQAGVEKTAFGFPVYLANDQGFYFLRNFQESDFYGYGDSSYSDQGAMAYVGQIYESSYGTQHLIYVLAAHGSIYRIKIRPSDFKMRRDVLGKTNLSLFDHKAMTMDYYNDGEKEGLIVGYNNALEGCVELHYIDLTDEDLTSTKLGIIPGATAISGLTLQGEQIYETHAVGTGSGIVRSGRQELAKPNMAVYEPIKASELMAQGSLNAAANLRPASFGAATGTEDTVTLEITARDVGGDISAHNGLFTVTYDASSLALNDVTSHADYKTIVTAEGSVRMAYADLEGFAAGESAATLTFRVISAEDTSLTVAHAEAADAFPGAVENIPVTFAHAATELRDAKDATCTEDGYTGDSYCALCGKLLARGEIIPASCPSARFADVPVDEWYHEAVDYAVESGLMNGISETEFDPACTLNRAQIITILYRLAGSPTVEAPAAFTDVPAGVFYSEAVAWAVEKGITNGVSGNRFDPSGAVTREQLVTFLYRYEKTTGADMTISGDLNVFEDADNVSIWAVEAFTWSVAEGIVTGVTDTTLEPGSVTNRAQTAMVLLRLAQ